MTESASHSRFDDLDDYLALPRVSGLAVSPDGSRVVTTVAELNDKRTEFVTAIWEVDPTGQQPARRLTRGAKGESTPVFTADGDVLFVAVRPTEDDDKPPASLWRLPAAGGEAVEELALPGGVAGVRTARAASTTVVAAKLLRSASDIDEDKRLRALRKDNKITAILHSSYPVRYWDHDLGPDHPHLLDTDGPRDLTPEPGDCLREADFDVSRRRQVRRDVVAWPCTGRRDPRHARSYRPRHRRAHHYRRRSRGRPGVSCDLTRRHVGGVHSRDDLHARKGSTNHLVPHAFW